MPMDLAAAGSGENFFKRESLRGTPGYIRAGQGRDGRWWLCDPEGNAWWLRAANGVRGAAGSAHEPAARLRAWGLNALGAGSDVAARDEGLPFVAAADFSAGAAIHASGVRLPDVFDPDWPRRAAAGAVLACAPLAESRAVVGWLADAGLAWSGARAGEARPTLLQICLSLEPAHAAYHAAWEFALAPHGGRLAGLARAWAEPELTNREVVRERTRGEHGLATRGHARDDARWTREFARRFFTVATGAIRAQAPNHLILGGASAGAAGAAVLAECVAPAVDVAWVTTAEALAARGGPVIAGEFTWVAEDFFGAPPRGGRRGLTAVERMLRRGRAALERLAAHPAAAGYAWRQWADGPAEQPPFGGGLVHANDAEAREHTELLADVNARLQTLRAPPL